MHRLLSLECSWRFCRHGFHIRVKIPSGCFQSHIRLLSNNDLKSRISEETNSPTTRTTTDSEVSLFARAKQLGWTFWNGTKALLIDQKRAVQLAMKYDQLNRKEREFIRNAKSEVVKILPVLILFCIPFVGYAAPFLAFKYPRRFLSNHFLTAKQIRLFTEQEYRDRSEAYTSLVQSTSNLTNKLNIKDVEAVLHGHPDEATRWLLKQENLNLMDTLFADPAVVSRDHLVSLCRSRRLSTWVRPTFLLQWSLKKSVQEVCDDDREIQSEGINALTSEDIVQACKWRGMKTVDINEQILSESLRQWLTISTAVAGMSPANVTSQDALRFAHVAVFVARIHEQKCATSNGQTTYRH